MEAFEGISQDFVFLVSFLFLSMKFCLLFIEFCLVSFNICSLIQESFFNAGIKCFCFQKIKKVVIT